MRNSISFLVTLFFLKIAFVGHAQIITAPDTVCVGEMFSLNFNHPNKFTTYTWIIGNTNINHIITSPIPIPNTATVGNSAFSVAAQATMVYDIQSNTYRGFVTSASTGNSNPSIQRLDFGTNPNTAPTTTNLGNPSNVLVAVIHGNLEAIEFAIDQFGIYHAFLTNRGIVHLVFGNGLGNAPTQAVRIYDNPSQMMMGMQLTLKNYNGGWHLFAGNTYGSNHIMRFDLGTDLNNIPSSLTNINLPAPISGFAGEPAYFSIIQRSNNWYLFVSALNSNSSSYLYNLGTNLLNNSPTISSIGNLNVPNTRGLNYIVSCDSFYQAGLTQTGIVYTLDYQNNISNIPNLQNLGNLFGPNKGMQMFKPYWYNDTLWALSSSYINSNINTVFRTALLEGNTGNTISKYYNPLATYAFNAPGVYDINLFCDQADPGGAEAYCKQIVVVNSLTSNSSKDTTLCLGDTIVLNPNGNTIYNSYLWNNGTTSASLQVFSSGIYWVTYSNTCGSRTDTFKVTIAPKPEIEITAEPTSICLGQSVQLSTYGASSYKWEPSPYLDNDTISNPVVQPTTTTTFYVSGISNSCVGKDSITIEVLPLPVINLTSDGITISCQKNSIQLYATGATRYEWQPQEYFPNPNISNPIVSPSNHTTFYVTGFDENGCSNSDSINILVSKETIFFVPNAFSPNGDGLNDQFKPFIYCDFELESFVIYNRYGNRVFDTNNPNIGWDGTTNGKRGDLGVYFWYIEGKRNNGEKVIEKGNVTLLK